MKLKITISQLEAVNIARNHFIASFPENAMGAITDPNEWVTSRNLDVEVNIEPEAKPYVELCMARNHAILDNNRIALIKLVREVDSHIAKLRNPDSAPGQCQMGLADAKHFVEAYIERVKGRGY